MTTLLTKSEAKTLVEKEQSGKIFTVTFVKRGTGEIRVMNCRTGVRKNYSGQGLKFDPSSKGLKSVFDMQKRQYRFISLEQIKRIKMNKREYKVI